VGRFSFNSGDKVELVGHAKGDPGTTGTVTGTSPSDNTVAFTDDRGGHQHVDVSWVVPAKPAS
jgi:hypothetical protein